MTEPNILYYGDNLDVLRRHIKDGSVDLVYLDPPFKSDADYNVLFGEHEAGFYESPWGRHPRIQLLTIRELLDGTGINYPHITGANVTLRRARAAERGYAQPLELFGRAAERNEPYGSIPSGGEEPT